MRHAASGAPQPEPAWPLRTAPFGLLTLGFESGDSEHALGWWDLGRGRRHWLSWGPSAPAHSLTLARGRPEVLAVACEAQGSAILCALRDAPGPAQRLHEEPGSAIYYPRLSPRGDRIAYLVTPGARSEIARGAKAELRILARRDERWAAQASSFPTLVRDFDWASDDSLWIHAPDGSLQRLHLDARGAVRERGPGTSFPRVSPDGATLALVAEQMLIVSCEGKDRACMRIGSVDDLCWTPDGGGLLYHRNVSTALSEICMADLESDAPVLLARAGWLNSLEALASPPAWPRLEPATEP